MLEYIYAYLDLWAYRNWQLATYSLNAELFVYLCVIAFVLGFLYGYLK